MLSAWNRRARNIVPADDAGQRGLMEKDHSIRSGLTKLILAGGILALGWCQWSLALAEPDCEFSAQRADFQVKFKDEICPYRVVGVFVLPGELLSLEAVGSGENEYYQLQTSAGRVTRTQTNRWFWRAPREAGLYLMTISRSLPADGDQKIFDSSNGDQAARLLSEDQALDPSFITLNIFVMIPFEQIQDECLKDFRIGRYPSKPLKGKAIYEPPRGFIEVTEENQETLISPHFKIEQFLCKQECLCPKYLVLRERLILKLERILEEFNRRGYCGSTLHIMSGYRTPYYNKLIGNVDYSRHLWGDAVDFFIDEDPRDEFMDDINGDGRIDAQDAIILHDIIEEVSGEPWYSEFIGGLGWYKKTSSHGPFVHTDVRGYRARW
jgi:hypothetical protein